MKRGKVMGWVNVAACAALIMVVLQAKFLPILTAAAEEHSDTCNGVRCGMGSCRISPNKTFGYLCDCEYGWNQLYVNELFGFLPCVIPNCTISYSCVNDTMTKSIPSIQQPTSFSLLDPCLWSYCGAGTCVETTGFRHLCKCKEGFTNLFNIPIFPCFKDCAVGADCINLGFTLSNGSIPTPPNTFAKNSGTRGSSSKKLLWLIFVTYLVMVLPTRT